MVITMQETSEIHDRGLRVCIQATFPDFYGPNFVALPVIHSDRLYHLDRDPRRGFSRAARILPGSMREARQRSSPQVLSFVYLRILLQPLRCDSFLIITRYKLLYHDWRGYLVALFALVWITNQCISIYNRLRLDLKHERMEIEAGEEELKKKRKPPDPRPHDGFIFSARPGVLTLVRSPWSAHYSFRPPDSVLLNP
jgi:hypothetical protein